MPITFQLNELQLNRAQEVKASIDPCNQEDVNMIWCGNLLGYRLTERPTLNLFNDKMILTGKRNVIQSAIPVIKDILEQTGDWKNALAVEGDYEEINVAGTDITVRWFESWEAILYKVLNPINASRVLADLLRQFSKTGPDPNLWVIFFLWDMFGKVKGVPTEGTAEYERILEQNLLEKHQEFDRLRLALHDEIKVLAPEVSFIEVRGWYLQRGRYLGIFDNT